MTIKRLFSFLSAVNGFLCVAILVILLLTVRNTQELQVAQENRYHSYLLADELRQSSDDLTRLARTFVVNGDSSYEEAYWEILRVRNGEAKRPENARIAPGKSVALLDLMRDAGVTEAEFTKLAQAQRNSDALVATEDRAMNIVEGQTAGWHSRGCRAQHVRCPISQGQSFHHGSDCGV